MLTSGLSDDSSLFGKNLTFEYATDGKGSSSFPSLYKIYVATNDVLYACAKIIFILFTIGMGSNRVFLNVGM